jgi:hypothetical protein
MLAWVTVKYVRAEASLEMRYLSLVHASCTKIVMRLSLLHARLQRVGKLAGGELEKNVSVYLLFPIFRLHHSVFKFGYAIGEQRLFLLTGERNSCHVHELGVYLGDCGDNLVVIGKSLSSRKKFAKLLETVNRRDDLRIHDNLLT